MIVQERLSCITARFPDGDEAQIPIKWVEKLLPGSIDDVEMYEGGPCVPVYKLTEEDLGRMLLEFDLRRPSRRKSH